MVTTWLAQEPPPPGSGGGGSAIGFLLLVGSAYLLWRFIKIQRDPLAVCGKCEGKPPGDGEGHRHRCRRCGGAAETLRWQAWLMLKCGIPVPRARRIKKTHPWAVPKDYSIDDDAKFRF
jgi:hypothetical protein